MYRDDVVAARGRRDAARAELARVRTPEALAMRARLDALVKENEALLHGIKTKESWTSASLRGAFWRPFVFSLMGLSAMLLIVVAYIALRSFIF